MTDEAPSIEPWLSALRDDVQPMSAQARERLAVRLASATMVGAAVVATPALSGAIRRGFLYSRAFTAALALPAGALIGAAGHAYLMPTAVPAVTSVAVAAPPIVLATVSSQPTAASAPAPTPTSAPAATVSSAAKLVVPPALSVKPEAAAPSLEQELSLLERARSSLSEGQPQATLQLLREHRATYPTSVLQQEREALSIRALAAAGRRSEAQRRAQAFIHAYPTSALRASVERAAGTIP